VPVISLRESVVRALNNNISRHENSPAPSRGYVYIRTASGIGGDLLTKVAKQNNLSPGYTDSYQRILKSNESQQNVQVPDTIFFQESSKTKWSVGGDDHSDSKLTSLLRKTLSSVNLPTPRKMHVMKLKIVDPTVHGAQALGKVVTGLRTELNSGNDQLIKMTAKKKEPGNKPQTRAYLPQQPIDLAEFLGLRAELCGHGTALCEIDATPKIPELHSPSSPVNAASKTFNVQGVTARTELPAGDDATSRAIEFRVKSAQMIAEDDLRIENLHKKIFGYPYKPTQSHSTIHELIMGSDNGSTSTISPHSKSPKIDALDAEFLKNPW
jgi:hypothetical protein